MTFMQILSWGRIHFLSAFFCDLVLPERKPASLQRVPVYCLPVCVDGVVIEPRSNECTSSLTIKAVWTSELTAYFGYFKGQFNRKGHINDIASLQADVTLILFQLAYSIYLKLWMSFYASSNCLLLDADSTNKRFGFQSVQRTTIGFVCVSVLCDNSHALGCG